MEGGKLDFNLDGVADMKRVQDRDILMVRGGGRGG